MPEDTKQQLDDKKEEPSKEEGNSVSKEPIKESEEEATSGELGDEGEVKEAEVKELNEEKEKELFGEEVKEDTVEEPKKEELPEFRVGDTIKILYRIIEGEKTRLQPFQGIVISKKGEGISKTFTVRRIGADKVGVERIFPLYTPNIEKLEVVKKGKVRRAKLYYLRGKKGREAMRIKERK